MSTSRLMVLAAAVAAFGCGSTIKYSGDSATDPDSPVDTVVDSTVDSTGDTEIDSVTDTGVDVNVDVEPDSPNPECSDGIDNDGDDLIDMEDFDCIDPTDDIEGPGDAGCSVDNHCEAGWWECDRATGTCYEPPEGDLCVPCYTSEDCGDGVTGEDVDRDYCVYHGMGGECSKDCSGDFDCPKGFYCDPEVDPPHPGMCIPVAGTCESMMNLGSACSDSGDCGWGETIGCVGSVCVQYCEIEHDCVEGSSCVEFVCVPD